MLRTASITLCWSLGLLVGSCSDDRISLSAAEVEEKPVEEPLHDTTAAAAQAAGPDKEPGIVTEAVDAPKQWPQCWLSSRLSAAEALMKNTKGVYSKGDGRQEFRGKAVNPTVEGDCIYSWFGQDNSSEPWIAMLQQDTSTDLYEAVVTCTADPTPDCTCMTIIPSSSITDPFLVGTCVRKDDIGNLVLFNVQAPEPGTTQPANGRCDTANSDLGKVVLNDAKRYEIFGMDEDSDIAVDDNSNKTCRVDIEPFSPRDDEKDWYGDEIRDWAVVTCEDEQTFCRSYAIFYKSSEDQDARTPVAERGMMLICKNGKCQQVADN